MTQVRPAQTADPGQWLLRPDTDWWDLVRYGPPGFAVYVRIAFAEPAEGEDPALRAALTILAAFTDTPQSGYAAIWEGWVGGYQAPRAPRLEVPNRAMLLFAGPIDTLRDAPAHAWRLPPENCFQGPHLAWPEDEAWCLACEVDEEIEFTVGCCIEAATALASALPRSVRRVKYGAPEPLYRGQS